MFWTARGFWALAITRSRPPQRGQARTSRPSGGSGDGWMRWGRGLGRRGLTLNLSAGSAELAELGAGQGELEAARLVQQRVCLALGLRGPVEACS